MCGAPICWANTQYSNSWTIPIPDTIIQFWLFCSFLILKPFKIQTIVSVIRTLFSQNCIQKHMIGLSIQKHMIGLIIPILDHLINGQKSTIQNPVSVWLIKFCQSYEVLNYLQNGLKWRILKAPPANPRTQAFSILKLGPTEGS